MRQFRNVEVICQKCSLRFSVKASVVWRTKLCPSCRLEAHREDARQRCRFRDPHSCIDCGKTIYGHKAITLRCRQCFFKYRRTVEYRTHEHKYIDAYGYVVVYAPVHQNKYDRKNTFIKEHRLIMEQLLNRPLKPTEIVHHLNGIKHDNRPQNLIVTDRSNHERDTIIKAFQKRIRDLEAELSQQRLV